MRRSLLAGLILSLGGLTPLAAAAEVVATASPQTAVASAREPARPKAAAVSLGRPRLRREAPAEAPSVLVPVAYQTPAAPVASIAPAPTTSPYAPVRAQPAPDEPPPPRTSLFAVERTAFFTPAAPEPAAAAPAPLPLPAVTTAPTPALPLGLNPSLPGNPCTDACAESTASGLTPDDLLTPAPAATGPGYRFYGSAEYLAWTTKNDRVPPLATTSTNPFDNGVLAPSQFLPRVPTTSILFGGPLDRETQSGARFRLGYWFDGCKPFAIEGSYFFLGPRSDNFFTGSNGSTVIARPFFDLNDNAALSQVVASPLTSAGTLSITSPSRLSGADLNLRCPLCCYTGCNGGYNVSLLAGMAYYSLREGLYITEQGMNFPFAPTAPGQAFRIDDRFDTTNSFYGGQVGLVAEARLGRWFVNTRDTLALGDTHQVLNINGSALAVNTDPTQIATMGVLQRQAGGLLALPGANIGRFTRDRFGFVPNLNFNVGYQVTNNFRIFVGYNFLYWSNVLRPGGQIDPRLDITRIPLGFGAGVPPTGLPNPVPLLKGTDFWAQGINLGLGFRY